LRPAPDLTDPALAAAFEAGRQTERRYWQEQINRVLRAIDTGTIDRLLDDEDGNR
jgi:hypothetical protein